MQAIVVHSGGMDSSICLQLAKNRFGSDHVLSLTFDYGQRHKTEINAAQTIADALSVENVVVQVPYLATLTENSLTNHKVPIANSLVVGRNGLFARLAAIYAHHLGATCIYMGVLELENSSYRDCSRSYMDKMEEILRIDLNNPRFEIVTPLIYMTKKETIALAKELGILELLLKESVTCYEGLKNSGCGVCPSCILRNRAITEAHPLIQT